MLFHQRVSQIYNIFAIFKLACRLELLKLIVEELFLIVLLDSHHHRARIVKINTLIGLFV